MQFSLKSRAQDILEDETTRRYLDIFFPAYMLKFLPASEWSRTIEDIMADKHIRMPWNGPFIGEALVEGANYAQQCAEGGNYRFLPLWETDSMDHRVGFHPEKVGKDKEGVCLIDITGDHSEGEMLPAVIIAPGGGYRVMATIVEGIRVAERFAASGYHPFILQYRLIPNRYPAPQLDMARAVQYVRSHAEELGIKKKDLMLAGSSAGGHLAATYVSKAKEYAAEAAGQMDVPAAKVIEYMNYAIPEKLCLSYPPITIAGATAPVPQENSDGCQEYVDEITRVETIVTKGFPRTFLWACEDDDTVPPDNAYSLHKALDKEGVIHMYRSYPTGGHGNGLSEGTSAESWFDEMLQFFKQQ